MILVVELGNAKFRMRRSNAEEHGKVMEREWLIGNVLDMADRLKVLVLEARCMFGEISSLENLEGTNNLCCR